MARPTKNDIDNGIQSWDGKMDDNDEVLFNGPLPIHIHTGDETDLEATFPAAMFDTCLVWVDDTTLGRSLYLSDGTNWQVHDALRRGFSDYTATTSHTISDNFVRFSGAGTVDFDLLPVASWPGQTVTLRNDKSSGTMNVDPDGSEVINALAGGDPFVVTAGDTVVIYNTGTKLYVSVMS